MRKAELRLEVAGAGEVSALLLQPADPRALFVLGHGAGAGMRHAFMEGVAHRLASRGFASLRYQFPYMEQGRRRPDGQPMLLATVRAAVGTAADRLPALPLLAGGKSMGGRMTSLAAAASPLAPVRGVVLFGFPLHAAGRPATERAAHLAEVALPLLFLQGTRDRLADLSLLGPICRKLGPRAALHVIEGADHGFAVLRKTGRTREAVLEELADVTAEWAAPLL